MPAPLKHAHRWRVALIALILLLGFAGMAARLAHVAIIRGDYYRHRAEIQHNNTVRRRAHRGDIFDREGRTLATSVMRETLYVNTTVASDAICDEVVETCARVFNRSEEYFRGRIAAGARPWIARRMEPDESEQIHEMLARLNLEEDIVYLDFETKRLYPRDTLASAVVGYTHSDDTGDNLGMTGVERSFNDDLRGQQVSERALHSASHLQMEPLGPETIARSAGHQVYLTIDSVIQREAEEALQETVEHFEADWGTCVVMRPSDGNVLAMANWPLCDLNNQNLYEESAKRNYAIMNQVEPGSVMKIFLFAAALELGLITEDELIDCHDGRWVHPTYRFSVTDDESHHLGLIPIREAFAFSSNVAAVQIGDRLGANAVSSFYRAFGFGQRTGIELPLESRGALLPGAQWRGTDFRANPTGQGVAVTALQTAAAVSAIANGGVWREPRIMTQVRDGTGQVIERGNERSVRRVVSSITARRMLGLMENVVVHGTGTDAAIAGFRVGGKTGTADRYDEEAHGYRGYVSTFAGVAPVDDPEVVCVVFIYNPNPRIGRYGGTVAAPVFQRVVASSLRILGVPADPTSLNPSPSVEVVLNTVERSGDRAGEMNLPSDLDGSSNLMPDLTGLTMREVVRRLSDRGVALHIEGTGQVMSQSPEPGESLEGVVRVEVEFGNPGISRFPASELGTREG